MPDDDGDSAVSFLNNETNEGLIENVFIVIYCTKCKPLQMDFIYSLSICFYVQ